MSQIFSPEDDELLIDVVKEHPLLYLVKTRNYKDSEVKNNIWKEIAKKTGKTEIECKVRWKSIRDYYQRKRKTVIKGRGSAADRDNFSIKFKNLSFLENTSFVERTSINNVNKRKSKQHGQKHKNKITDIDVHQDPPDTNTVEKLEKIEADGEKLGGLEVPVDVSIVNRKRVRRTKEKQLVPRQIKKGRVKKITLPANCPKQESILDKCDAATAKFFESITLLVSTFSPALRTKARVEVMNIISQLELQDITRKNELSN